MSPIEESTVGADVTVHFTSPEAAVLDRARGTTLRKDYAHTATMAAANAVVPPPPPPPDTSAPSTPLGVQATLDSAGTVHLSWQGSLDDRGVTGYDIHRGTPGFTPSPATLHATVSTMLFAEVGVPGTTWAYRIVAGDAAGNKSAASAEVDIAIPAAPPPPPPPVNPVPPAVIAAMGTFTEIWSDEFEGTAIDATKWNVQDQSTFGSGNNEEERYMKANVAVHDGALHLIGKQEATSGSDGARAYTSGMVTTRAMGGAQKFKFGGGGKTCYAEIEAACPAHGGGWWPAFWLVGADTAPGWPAYGEIDDAEWYGTYPNMVESTYHWAESGSNKQQGGQSIPVVDITKFHTYGVLWEPKKLTYVVDGKVTQQFNATTPGALAGLGYEHTIHLNLAIGGDGPRVYHDWDGSWAPGDLPGEYQIRSIRVWQKA